MASKKRVFSTIKYALLCILFGAIALPLSAADFTQRLEWKADKNVFEYKVEIQPASGESKLISTEKNFVELSLPAGQYRYRVHAYDFLGREARVSEWTSFEILKASTPEITLPKESVDLSSDSKTLEMPVTIADITGATTVELVNAATGKVIKGTLVGSAAKGAVGSETARATMAQFKNVPEGEWKLRVTNPSGLASESAAFSVIDRPRIEKERLAEEAAAAAAAAAAAKAAEELRIAEEKAEQKRLLEERKEAERIAKAEEEQRIAEEKAEQKRLLEEQEEAERIAKAEEKERIAEEKAEQKRLLEEQKEAERVAKAEEKAEQKRLEEEQKEAERVAKAEEKERVAEEKKRIAEEKKVEEEKKKAEKEKEKAEKREKRVYTDNKTVTVALGGGLGFVSNDELKAFNDSSIMPMGNLRIDAFPVKSRSSRFGFELWGQFLPLKTSAEFYDISLYIGSLQVAAVYRLNFSYTNRLFFQVKAGGGGLLMYKGIAYTKDAGGREDASKELFLYPAFGGGLSLGYIPTGFVSLEIGVDGTYGLIQEMNSLFIMPYISLGLRL